MQEVRRILRYDPDTGYFFWRVPLGSCAAGSKAGVIHPTGYVVITIAGKHYLAHRLAHFYQTGEWPSDDIDHKDRDRSQNRWENIRPATRSQNGANAKVSKRNVSGLKGVSLHKISGL